MDIDEKTEAEIERDRLIEHFISLLGDNSILGKYMSIDEIRFRLKQNISGVIYETKNNIYNGQYTPKTKLIHLAFLGANYNEFEENCIIVHEFLHALSTSIIIHEKEDSSIEKTIKCGLQIGQELFEKKGYNPYWICFENEKNRELARGINEGLTNLLVAEILMQHYKNYILIPMYYSNEQDFCRLICGLYGKDYLVRKYFERCPKSEIENPASYLFGSRHFEWTNNEIIRNQLLEEKMNTILKDIDQLLWYQIISKNDNGKEINGTDVENYYKKLQEHLISEVKELIVFVLHNISEKDAKEIIPNVLESLRMFSDKRMNYRDSSFILDLSREDLASCVAVYLKESRESLGKMVDIYARLTDPNNAFITGRSYSYLDWLKTIEEYCIKNRIVSKKDFSKSAMLGWILHSNNNIRNLSDYDIKQFLEDFSYIKVGSHYMLKYNGEDYSYKSLTEGEGVWFDESGKKAYPFSLYRNRHENNKWYIDNPLYDNVDFSKVNKILEKLNKSKNINNIKIDYAIVIGNNVIFYNEGMTRGVAVYTLNEEGELVLAKEESPKRITDDMSEFDISFIETIKALGITNEDIKKYVASEIEPNIINNKPLNIDEDERF